MAMSMEPELSPSRRHQPKRSARFEVLREKKPGRGEPDVEVHLGLDYARLAALGYALEGPKEGAPHYSGRVRIRQVWVTEGVRGPSFDLDVLDESVASRFLYAVEIPRARSDTSAF